MTDDNESSSNNENYGNGQNRRSFLRKMATAATVNPAAVVPSIVGGANVSQLVPFQAFPEAVRKAMEALSWGVEKNETGPITELYFIKNPSTLTTEQTADIFFTKLEQQMRRFCDDMQEKESSLRTIQAYFKKNNPKEILEFCTGVVDKQLQSARQIQHFELAANLVEYCLNRSMPGADAQLASLFPLVKSYAPNTLDNGRLGWVKRMLGFSETESSETVLAKLKIGLSQNTGQNIRNAFKCAFEHPKGRFPISYESPQMINISNFLWKISWDSENVPLINNMENGAEMLKQCLAADQKLYAAHVELDEKFGVGSIGITAILSPKSPSELLKKETYYFPWMHGHDFGFTNHISQSPDQIPQIVDSCLSHVQGWHQNELANFRRIPNVASLINSQMPSFLGRVIPELMQEYFPDFYEKKLRDEEHKKNHVDREKDRRAQASSEWQGLGNDYY